MRVPIRFCLGLLAALVMASQAPALSLNPEKSYGSCCMQNPFAGFAADDGFLVGTDHDHPGIVFFNALNCYEPHQDPVDVTPFFGVIDHDAMFRHGKTPTPLYDHGQMRDPDQIICQDTGTSQHASQRGTRDTNPMTNGRLGRQPMQNLGGTWGRIGGSPATIGTLTSLTSGGAILLGSSESTSENSSDENASDEPGDTPTLVDSGILAPEFYGGGGGGGQPSIPVSPIPLPASVVLLLFGLFGLSALRIWRSNT